MIGWLRRLLWWSPPVTVTQRWLREHQIRDDTKGLDSVTWRWPVKKQLDESGLWNTRRLKKRA